MNNNNLLQDFLDASLPDNLQKELFDKLAQDEALRRELQINMGIEKFARRDKANYKIPAELTQSVFSDLGIAFPVPNKSDNRKGLVMVMALLLLGFFVAGGSYLLYTNYLSKQSSVNEASKAKVNVEKNIPTVSSFAINSESYANGYEAGKKDAITKIAALNRRLNSSKTNSESSDLLKSQIKEAPVRNSNSDLLAYAEDAGSKRDLGDSQESEHSNSFKKIEPVNENISSIRASTDFASEFGQSEKFNGVLNQPQMNSIISLNPINLFDPMRATKWNVIFRKLPTRSLNQSSIQSKNTIYANTAFGLSYNFSRNSNFGVEFGYENFSQQFTLQGGTLKYDQNPLMLWYGGFWNYTPSALNIAGIVQPYTQIFAGATSVGPLVKAQAGISVNILRNIYLNFGAEYGMLIYRVENNYYNSRNVGGTMGLKFSF